jgi:hypothetical protein
MFKKTKKRCENIKNFGKETFKDIKEIKNIQDLDGNEIKVIILLLISGLGIGYLISFLPSWLYGIFIAVLILLYLVAIKYDKKN